MASELNLRSGPILNERGYQFSSFLGVPCAYCSKIFKDSKLMLKHVTRRHFSELNTLHEQVQSEAAKNAQQRRHPEDIKYSKKDIKEQLDAIKNFLRVLCDKILEIEKCLKNYKDEQTSADRTHQELFKNLTDDVQTLRSSIMTNTTMIEKRQDEFERIIHGLKMDVNDLKTLRASFSNMESNILEKFELNIVPEIHNMILRAVKENNQKLYAHITELRNEVNELLDLKKVVLENSRKLYSPEHFQQVLKEHLSIVMPEQRLKTPVCSKLAKRRNRHSQNSKSMNKNKSIHTLASRDICVKHSDAKSLLENKLHCMNISSELEKLSNSQFEEKLKLLQVEKDNQMKNVTFAEVYEEVNAKADNRSKKKLLKQSSKNVRFSVSPEVERRSSFENAKLTESNENSAFNSKATENNEGATGISEINNIEEISSGGGKKISRKNETASSGDFKNFRSKSTEAVNVSTAGKEHYSKLQLHSSNEDLNSQGDCGLLYRETFFSDCDEQTFKSQTDILKSLDDDFKDVLESETFKSILDKKIPVFEKSVEELSECEEAVVEDLSEKK